MGDSEARQPGYTRLQIILHWIVAILIIGAFVTHDEMHTAFPQRVAQGQSGFEGATLHTIIGGIVFVIIVVRLVVYLRTGTPGAKGPALVAKAAKWGHRLLYALMVIVPVLGATAWYGKMPDIGALHAIVGKALVLIALVHALIAILHSLVWKDGTLSRMFRVGSPN